MARAVNPKFYTGRKWQKCREAYIKAHPLCERCLANGDYNPAKYIHHRTELTEENVRDPAIAYGFDNLEALCFKCHEELHGRRRAKRYTINSDGTVDIV